MFLLSTVLGAFLGVTYARVVNRRFGPRDWRRWAALAPFWLLAGCVAIASQTVNMSDPATQAVQAFAIGTLAETLVDWIRRAVRRRRADVSTSRE